MPFFRLLRQVAQRYHQSGIHPSSPRNTATKKGFQGRCRGGLVHDALPGYQFSMAGIKAVEHIVSEQKKNSHRGWRQCLGFGDGTSLLFPQLPSSLCRYPTLPTFFGSRRDKPKYSKPEPGTWWGTGSRLLMDRAIGGTGEETGLTGVRVLWRSIFTALIANPPQCCIFLPVPIR